MEHPYEFDPTYGYGLDALLKVGAPDAPDDFEAYWRETYEQTMAVPPRPTGRGRSSVAQGNRRLVCRRERARDGGLAR